jgi:flagellar hook-associated protein 2
MASPITASSTIDVQSIVSSMMQVERKPLTQLQTEAKKIETKISAYGKLQSQIAAFRDAAAELSKSGTWQTVKASSSASDAVDVTAGTGAVASQHAVTVEALAQSQTVASGTFASGDAIIGSGTLRIQLGTQPSGGASFTADGARAEISVTVPADATLAQVRDRINAANAGVRAAVVRDGDQVRLFLSSANTGANQAFRIQVDDADGGSTDGAGLSALAFDPTAAAGAGRNLSLVRSASDASFTIDGVALTSRTNRVAGAMDGIDLTFKKVTTAPVQVDVTVDTEAMEAATRKFVDAYNSLNSLLAEQTAYNASTKTGGPLQGDRSAVSILGQVRSIVRETVAGGTLATLSDAGMTLQRNGSLALSAERLKSVAAEPSALARLFAAAGTDATDRGLMRRFVDLADRLVGSEGSVKAATDAWAARKASNSLRQSAIETRLSDVEKRLLRQYSALDAQLAAAQQSQSAVASALAGLPRV